MYELPSGSQQSCQHAVSDSDRQAREKEKDINVKHLTVT